MDYINEPIRMICENCVYSLRYDYRSERTCYRYPPTIFRVGGCYYSKRPEVNNCDFCGEFKAKK